MLRPMTPALVTASVRTSGDSATTPLAVRWGCMGTQTARTLRLRSFVGLFGIMKDDTESPAISRSDFADTMTDADAVRTTLAGGGAVAGGDDEGVALAWKEGAAHRLSTRRILDEE